MLKKTLDFQPIKIPNSCKNSMNTKIRLPLMIKKIISWNKKWTLFWKRTQILMSKSETLNKISDLVQIKWVSSMLNLMSIRTESRQITKSLILIVKEFKNSYHKTVLWEKKFVMLKRTWDFQLAKWANSRMSSRWSVQKMNNSREEFSNQKIMSKNISLMLRTKLLY
jgi:hypothetical protein